MNICSARRRLRILQPEVVSKDYALYNRATLNIFAPDETRNDSTDPVTQPVNFKLRFSPKSPETVCAQVGAGILACRAGSARYFPVYGRFLAAV